MPIELRPKQKLIENTAIFDIALLFKNFVGVQAQAFLKTQNRSELKILFFMHTKIPIQISNKLNNNNKIKINDLIINYYNIPKKES